MDSNMKNLYYKISFYKEIIFDKFLEQLEKGNISIQFTVSTFSDDTREVACQFVALVLGHKKTP